MAFLLLHNYTDFIRLSSIFENVMTKAKKDDSNLYYYNVNGWICPEVGLQIVDHYKFSKESE